MANGKDFTVNVQGLDELERKLKQLAPQAAKRALRKAGKKAGEIWQGAIEESAPRDTGHLADSINIKTAAVNGNDGSLTVKVGPAGDAYYGMFQEFGTRFQPAQPFIRPAFEDHTQDVLDAFAEALAAGLKELE